ncbi:MAG: VCBS repeat-containing protein [Deltaproteobacteria bacterium]|nr:VCBS repeat-containing protein [Deltaproteobacteria bacterium]
MADLDKAFHDYSFIDVARPELVASLTASSLELPLRSGTIDLEIEAHDLRSPGYRAIATDATGTHPSPRAEVQTYRGMVVGDPGTQVRLGMGEHGLEGYFVNGGERYFIEPASTYSSAARDGALVVYKEGDALHADAATCDHVGEKITVGTSMLAAAPPPTLRVIEMATDADHEFVTQLGGAAQANAEILHILNMVEGVYEAELGLTIEVGVQHVWSTPDPYNGASIEALLASFRQHWNNNFTQVQRDAAHLFSAKPNAASRGYAYLDVICTQASAYGVSGWIDYQPARFLIAGHELGHNLGAAHVEAGAGCENTLMNAQLTGTTPLTFCSTSRAQIASAVAIGGSCLATQQPPVTGAATPFDFDADGRADISVFRPANGTWYHHTGTAFSAVAFGVDGDRPVAADYDGDGKTDAAVYRGGTWYRLFSSTGAFDGVQFGLADDVPVPADYDGDGLDDIAIWRPSTGEWWVMRSSDNSHYAVTWGRAGDVPLTGDYTGDGRADYIIFRPSDSGWHRLSSSDFSYSSRTYGVAGDQPVSADFDGDGRVDIAVWRPSNGVWYRWHSSDDSFANNAFGIAGDIPVAADYDGDGSADLAVFRPSSSEWYVLNTTYSVRAFGQAGDIPVPAIRTGP